MPEEHRQTTQASYLNPLFQHDFPDPYVLKHRGEYWAYCTGFWDDGRCFGVLHSRDLVHWQPLAGAMAPLPEGHTCYWAPEVTYENGRFYLYYSAGNEEQMQIRVALADDPAGPFVDSGRRLTAEPFAIDPHVFVDEDGARFLFYATDFLDYERIGTGTVRDRMLDPFTLAGKPQPVTRARFDWQIYDLQRVEKGGVCWHTIEGPFVLRHKDLYYQMFSGGNWRDPGYGVCYAVSDSLDGSAEWEQACDGAATPPILLTVPGTVIGPGHNSVVRGPDNRQLYCVYHRWATNRSGRLLAIDPLEWAGGRLLVLGPSRTPQPAPLQPAFADYFDGQGGRQLGPAWESHGGRWQVGDGEVVQELAGVQAEARCLLGPPAFLAEVSLRQVGQPFPSAAGTAAYGLILHGEGGPRLRFQLLAGERKAAVSWREPGGWGGETLALAAEFEPAAYQLLRMEVNGDRVRLELDGHQLRWQGRVAPAREYQVGLYSDRVAAAFSGFSLTLGWEDLFIDDGAPTNFGWQAEPAIENWRINNGLLRHRAAGAERLRKGPLFSAYELVVNARLDGSDETSAYGFYPALRQDGGGPLLTVERENGGWSLLWREPEVTVRFPLPAEFDPTIMQQFRFRIERGWLSIQWDETTFGEGLLLAVPANVGLYARGDVAFDLVRVTAIGNNLVQ